MTGAAVGAIGAGHSRREDRRLLAGEGAYVGNVRLPDMLHLAVVRSEYAHAMLGDVDLSGALAVEGVVDAFSAAEIESYNKPLPTRVPPPDDLAGLVQRPLARERVRYVGEPIAVIVAETRAVAEDAASQVTASYAALPAIASINAALVADAPQLYRDRSNVVSSYELVKGDVSAGLDVADVIVTESFAVQRHTGSPLETRGLVAAPDSATGGVSIWGAAKVPQHYRRGVAQMLGLAEELVQCVATDVGGGFGVRGEFHPEDVMVPLACLRTKRPVQWIEDRGENLLGTNHSREIQWELTAGLSADGMLLALDAKMRLDFGAYVRPMLDHLAYFAGIALQGPYRIAHFRCQGQSVLTNKMGIGTVRSPGTFEATFARERLLDICAARVGLGPTELRRRNLIHVDELPFDTGVGLFGEPAVYDGGDYHAALDAVIASAEPEYAHLRQSAKNPLKRVGMGMACTVEATGWGQAESARVRYSPDGKVTLYTASSAMGQGHATSLAQIAADVLGIDAQRIELVQADTRFAPPGEGTFASRTMSMVGSAVLRACENLRGLLEVTPDPSEPIEATATYRFERESFPFAASVAIVEVDVELGSVRVLKYVVAVDVGTVINPKLLRGQLAGGAVFGMGGALLEELRYAEDGQPMTTSFMDYLLPSSLDVPEVETILIDSGPSPSNPLGVRGAGEIGTPGAAPAITNAVVDALGPGAGAITALPLTPDRVLTALLREEL